MGHQNSRHHHLDRRHNLLYDSSWKDLNQYKLLTIQTARHFSDKLWLNYNITFRKEAAASGCHMHPDLYNFHTRSLATTSAASGSSTSSALSLTEPLASSGNPKSSQYWHSWNDGCCCWPFGHCRFRHSCETCHRDDPRIRSLTALHGDNGPAPLLSQKGVTAMTGPPLLANSVAHSFDSVLTGSHGNLSGLELRSPFVSPS